MATCNDPGCSCVVRGGTGITVTGAGSATSPYEVTLDGDLSSAFVVEDTTTVNLTLLGQGTPVSPFRLSATSMMRLTELADVSDPEGGPIVGDVPVWTGTGDAAHWEFRPPPANPGAVNVGNGLIGDGTAGAPLRVRMVGTTAGGTTAGLEVYYDSVGNLRAVPPASSSVAWSAITGKPTVFPTDDANFSGVLSPGKGGTGQTALSAVTVGNATKVDGHRIFVQSATPSGAVLDDLWFY